MQHAERAPLGRVREQTELLGGLDQVASGRGTLFLLVGEPGIGKTFLAEAFSETARARGLQIAWGRCWEAGGAPAYWPWKQLVRELGREFPSDPAAGALDPTQARFMQFEAVLDDLREIAKHRPLLVILDDLHAADASSLTLLHFVARRLRGLPVFIIGTYRDADARMTPEIGELLTRIAREGTYVPMRRFDDTEVAALASRMSVELGRDQLALVYRVTEGNPLFVEQVLRFWFGREPLRGRGVPIPDSVREAVAERLQRLDPAAATTLQVAAVIGRELPTPLLAATLAEPIAVIRARVASALRAGVLASSDDATIGFAHVLYQEELYAGIAPERRAQLHADVLAALERLHAADPDPPLQMFAHHALAAITATGASRAVPVVLRAAEQAMHQLAFEDAATLLERTLAELEPEPAVHGELLIALGRARIFAGHPVPARQACRKAAEIARTLADAPMLARAALTYGEELMPGMVDRELVGLLEDSAARLSAHEIGLRARVQARLAAARLPAPDPSEPLAMAREAIGWARELGDATLRAVLHTASSALAAFAEPQERIGLNLEIVELSGRARDRVQMLLAHARLVMDYMEIGEIGRADASLEACTALAAEFRNARQRTFVGLLRATRALFDGRFDEVDRHHAEAHETRIFEHDAHLRGALTYQRHCRLLFDDRFDDLVAHEPKLRATFAHSSMSSTMLECMLARVHARRGATQQIDDHVCARARERVPPPFWALLMAETVAVTARPDEAQAVYDALLPYKGRFFSTGLGLMVVETPIDRLLGLIARALGRLDAAAAHLADALARAQQADSRFWIDRVRADLAALDGFGAHGDAKIEPGPAVSPGPEASHTTGAAPKFELRLEGEYFTIAWADKIGRFKDSIGLRLLAQLLERAHEEQHVLALLGYFAEASDAGEAIDKTAARAYRARLEQLREIASEAEELGNFERAEQARDEMERLAAELSRSLGLGGRARKDGSTAERARINVQRHIRKAIRKIADVHPELAEYLDVAVKTGTYCVYDPPRALLIAN